MLAVVASPPAENGALVGRNGELSVSENCCDARTVFVLERARISRDAALDQGLDRLVDLEQLRHEAPVPVEPVGHALGAFLGAVAKTNRPFGGQFAVIGHFLDRLRRELAQELVARTG
jgi:hypothetical protein